MKILVTGGSRGIGKAICEELSSLGQIYTVARDEELLKQCKVSGYCVCDLAKESEKICQYIEDIGFNCVINNAGEYIYGGIETMTEGQIKEIFETNLITPVRIIKSAVPYMKQKKWGRIINIGSISGVMGEGYASLYSSTKSGLIGLTKSLALELAEFNITVNIINPGWVDTELGNSSIEKCEFSREEILDIIPQKRFVSPDEVAKLVKYLISDSAKGITGQSINLCAGLSVGI